MLIADQYESFLLIQTKAGTSLICEEMDCLKIKTGTKGERETKDLKSGFEIEEGDKIYIEHKDRFQKVKVDREMREQAKDEAKAVDGKDIGRSNEIQERDSYIGNLGEIVFAEWLDGELEGEWNRVDKGIEYDFVVQGEKIDVKTRYNNDHQNDVLIRERNGLTADKYVQVVFEGDEEVFNETKAFVVGFVNKEQLEDNFEYGNHEKKIYRHIDLTPFNSHDKIGSLEKVESVRGLSK